VVPQNYIMNQQGTSRDQSWLSRQQRSGDDELRVSGFKPGLEQGILEEDEQALAKVKFSFEIKLTFFACIVFLYPVTLLIVLDSKPSVVYWVGRWALWSVFAVPVWLLFCHIAVASGVLRRGLAPLYILMVPAAWLVLLCEIQARTFASVGTWLISEDCHTYGPKVYMQNAWMAADSFYLNCSQSLANFTGASLVETVQLLNIKSCDGYDQAAEGFQKQWQYLEGVEQYQGCGGWCTRQRAIWTSERTQDSCSAYVAREISESIGLMGYQLAVYSIIVLIGTSLVLMASPSWMPTA